jgi:dienelactone hydrolase
MTTRTDLAAPPTRAPFAMGANKAATVAPLRAATLAASLVLAVLLSACAARSPTTPTTDTAADPLIADSISATRAASLALAIPMPDSSTFETRYFAWDDTARQRNVSAKLYLPIVASASRPVPVPLVVFSHGLGGSREGYSYLGKYWASQGYASLHLQHVGSDRSLWGGNPLGLPNRLKTAARSEEAIARAGDMRFAVDQILASDVAPRLDAQRLAAAGHSYGANTTLLVAGAQVQRTVDGQTQVLSFRDPRFKAAVVISAPPFYGSTDFGPILGPVRIPIVHITSTGDEIQVPGHHSAPSDRIKVFDATGSAYKTLAVFKDGSHSMFTDRLNTGGTALNPLVKIATRDLTLAFFKQVFEPGTATSPPTGLTGLTGPTPPGSDGLRQWADANQPLLARFDLPQGAR